ncbi:MAG TPA: iron-sulfur cluster assembly protein, partial [Verrucomicrobiae bacterium]
MSQLSADDIKNALKAVKYPGYSRDIVSFGLVKQIAHEGGTVNVRLELSSANPEAARQIKAESERVLRALAGATAVRVEVAQPAPPP